MTSFTASPSLVLIKGEDGKTEFVFEDEISNITKSSQTSMSPMSTIDSTLSYHADNENEGIINSKEIDRLIGDISISKDAEVENNTTTPIGYIYDETFAVVPKEAIEQRNIDKKHDPKLITTNIKKKTIHVRNYNTINESNGVTNHNKTIQSDNEKQGKEQKNYNVQKSESKNNIPIHPKCGPKSYKDNMEIKFEQKKAPRRLRRRTDTENSVELDNLNNEREEEVELIEERVSNLPGSPHPSSRLRSNRLDIMKSRNTSLSPTQTIMVGLDGETLFNSPSALSPSNPQLLNPVTSSPLNDNKNNTENKTKTNKRKKKKGKRKKGSNSAGVTKDGNSKGITNPSVDNITVDKDDNNDKGENSNFTKKTVEKNGEEGVKHKSMPNDLLSNLSVAETTTTTRRRRRGRRNPISRNRKKNKKWGRRRKI